MAENPASFEMVFEEMPTAFNLSYEETEDFALEMEAVTLRPYMFYTGAYEVTPSGEIQILETDHKSMSRDVVINPIPSNYGLVTYNGSYLTVS